jgi:ribosome assembly protein YihI (activator of Der GTPase)
MRMNDIEPTYDCLKKILQEILEDGSKNSTPADIIGYIDEVINTLNKLEPKLSQEYVFGIVEDEDMFGPGDTLYQVYITDKKTWEEDGHMSDLFIDEINELMEKVGFGLSMDNVYEEGLYAEKRSKKETMQLMKDIGLKYNEDFEDFVQP